MAGSVHNGWFKGLKELLAELDRSEVVEFELVQDGTRIYWLKNGAALPPTDRSPVASFPPDSGQTDADGREHLAVCSPLTGVCYLSPSPEASDYVQVGDAVQVGQIVGLVEAMKVFNEIRAEKPGRVAAILVQHGQVVQKGQALLQLEPATAGVDVG